MAVVSQTAVKEVLLKMLSNVASHAHRAELHVRACQSLRHRYQVGLDFPVVYREPLAGTTKAGHHFVRDQQDAMLVANVAQALHVTIRRNQDSIRAGYRFDNDRG